MAVVIDGAQKRIGLALSGGGFRAAGFHLGVMRKLHELNLLGKIDLISCVSGGSIAGGAMAAGWSDLPATLERLEQYLQTKSIAISSVIGGVFDPFHTRLDKLADSYDRDLFDKKTLAQLKNGPRVYFNATNLSTGNMFFFVAGEGGKEEMGEHELGVFEAPDFSIARAVAASSSFPPVFPPLRLDSAAYPCKAVEYVTLCDGGVYDNMGINPLLRMERNRIDYMIVSDGGKPFANDERPTESGAIVLKAAIDIMMEQIRGLEFDRIEHRYSAKAGPKPLWFSIDSKIGEQQAGDARFASSIGTNLERLTSEEIAVLTRHGAALLSKRIADHAPELLRPQPK